MSARFQPHVMSWLSAIAAVVVAISAISAQSSFTAVARTAPSATRPRIHVDAPVPGALSTGVAIIRFRTEHVHIASLFTPAASSIDSTPPAHVHVTVDGASWHWVHSTTDPVVIAPLSPGEHTVIMELAGADHRPLDTQSVRFTVALPSARSHPGHR